MIQRKDLTILVIPETTEVNVKKAVQLLSLCGQANENAED